MDLIHTIAELRARLKGVGTVALVPTVRLESGYRQAAKTMVALLAAAKPVDDQARAFALTSGDVPPGSLPDAAPSASPGSPAP